MRLLSILTLLFPLMSQAAFKSLPEFSPEEKELHKKTLSIVMSKAAACLDGELKRQQDFHRRYGIAAYYGATSKFIALTPDQRRLSLRQMGLPERLADELKVTSCVDYATRCLAAGFAEAKQDAIWAKLRKTLKDNGGDGSALQEALHNLGWRTLYWNADVSQNRASDAAERALDAKNTGYFWGYHEEQWKSVSTKGRYYLNTVDDAKSMVNFGGRVPKFLKKVPYFLGSAHMGYHIYTGIYGQVYEAHASREITDAETVERAPFGPDTLGGGPHGAFKSGLLTVPPGY